MRSVSETQIVGISIFNFTFSILLRPASYDEIEKENSNLQAEDNFK